MSAGAKRETIYEDKVFSLVWDPVTGVLESTALGQMSSTEFRASLERLLATIRDRRARKCIADMANVVTIAPEDLIWSDTDWFPRCIKAGVKVFAVVMPKSLAGHLVLDKAFERWNGEAFGHARKFFVDAQSAKEWIVKQ